MIHRWVHDGFKGFFDGLARLLVRIGCTANVLTFAGMLVTCAAGLCLAHGAGARWDGGPDGWLLAAGLLMVASAFCDFLDGKVARLGQGETDFGAFWDSTLDRVSDTALFAGIAWYYLARGNVTFVLLCFSAATGAIAISYTLCRAEHFIDSCKVGYWQRPERLIGLAIAVFFHKVPAFMVFCGATIWWSVLSRIWYTWRVMEAQRQGRPIRREGLGYALEAFVFWYHRRRSVVYFLTTGLFIAGYVLIPFYGGGWDPVGHWLGR